MSQTKISNTFSPTFLQNWCTKLKEKRKCFPKQRIVRYVSILQNRVENSTPHPRHVSKSIAILGYVFMLFGVSVNILRKKKTTKCSDKTCSAFSLFHFFVHTGTRCFWS